MDRGLGAEVPASVLLAVAVRDSDATVVCSALDSLGSDAILRGIRPALFTTVLKTVAAHHASRHVAIMYQYDQ